MNKNRIKSILDSGYKAVLVTTGGGSTAFNALLTTPGASRFVADAQIPYSPEALSAYLGEEIEQSCSSETARKLAAEAFKFQVSNFKFLAVSCTAALQTDRERRGADRAFICIKTEQVERLYALHFSKTSREEQEVLLSDWLLVLIAQAVGAERGLMFPGSFNPLHQGHCNLLAVAEGITGLRGVFELSCANVDKPDIPEEEILRRASAIKDIPVALTHAPRFVQKAELFPKTTFVLGTDTAARLVGNHTLQGMVSEFSKGWENQWEFFQSWETSFLVAGRNFQILKKDSDLAPRPVRHSLGEVGSAETRRSRFQGLENLKIPENAKILFEAIPESKFREDISSTELRGEGR